MSATELKKLLPFVYIVVIAGFISGLIISVLQISSHEYISYGAYNLVLSSLWHYLTKYTVLAFLASLVLILLISSVAKLSIFKKPALSKLLNKRVFCSVLIALILAYVLGLVFRHYSTDIFSYLKGSALNDLLGKLSDSKKETRKIYKSAVTISGILFFILCTYVLFRFRVSDFLFRSRIFESVIRGLNKIVYLRITTYIAATLAFVLILFNIYIFSYKSPPTPENPNVILISIDTLRADRLGSYGNPRNTSPNIDKLAAQGVLFENAYTQAPWTLPAMATVHTSLYPTEHGAIQGSLGIKDNLNTLAEYMKNNNYKTMAVTTHPYVNINHGFAQGFDIFDEKNHRGANDSSAERISQKAIKLISDSRDSKFFLWVHYFDPHSAYINHQEHSYGQKPEGNLPDILNAGTLNKMIDKLNPKDVEYISDIYDEEISYTDTSVGELIGALDTLGLKEDTVIIITADHGEELLDRTRFGHGRNTYNELIHVPLIIYHPHENELAGLRVSNSVETREIPKTVLAISGIDSSNFGGNNLFDVLRDNGNTHTYLAFSEGSANGSKGTVNQAVIGDGWKLIRNLRDDTFELYDLESDPGEKINLIESEEPDTEIMRNKLTSALSEFKKERLVELEKVEFSQEDLDELKALGYMQ